MANHVVVDTSIAAKWVVPEHDSQLASDLLDGWLANGITLFAPSWFACEFTNVIYK